MMKSTVVFWLTGWMFTLGVGTQAYEELGRVLSVWEWLGVGIGLLGIWPVLLGASVAAWCGWGG